MKENSYYYSYFKARKWRLREVKQLAQSLPSTNWSSWGDRARSPHSQLMLFLLAHTEIEPMCSYPLHEAHFIQYGHPFNYHYSKCSGTVMIAAGHWVCRRSQAVGSGSTDIFFPFNGSNNHLM